MDNHITELDKAELRHECREMFNDIGFDGCLEVMTESIMFNQIMLEVLREEYENFHGNVDEHR